MIMHKETPTSKTKRQTKLLDIVRSQAVTTQAELSSLLIQAGIHCTQVSVSRDIRELGLVKKDGRYIVPDESTDIPDIDELANTVSGFIRSVETVGENLVVVQTLQGTANGVALLLDAVNWPGIAGTVAGDDTVFVAVRSDKAGQIIVRNLRKLM
ncbi:MAG: arginine repressor [Proteobacteria bacterium]|nr:arginine repressor [Pseudomonadota bacterium]